MVLSFKKLLYKTIKIPQSGHTAQDLPWSSLVNGDEQLDPPKSQTTPELCQECVAYFFWGGGVT